MNSSGAGGICPPLIKKKKKKHITTSLCRCKHRISSRSHKKTQLVVMAIYEWLTIDDVKKSMSPFLHFNLAIKRPATTINRSEKTPERVRCRFLRRSSQWSEQRDQRVFSRIYKRVNSEKRILYLWCWWGGSFYSVSWCIDSFWGVLMLPLILACS